MNLFEINIIITWTNVKQAKKLMLEWLIFSALQVNCVQNMAKLRTQSIMKTKSKANNTFKSIALCFEKVFDPKRFRDRRARNLFKLN
jgi:hypothetical protein